MKPYYKRDGFFHRLERLSDWIDMRICHFYYVLKLYGFMYFVPGFRRLATLEMYIVEAEFDVCMSKKWLRKVVSDYNREKYWWMSAKQ